MPSSLKRFTRSLFGTQNHSFKPKIDMAAVLLAQEEDRQRREEQFKMDRQENKVQHLQVVQVMEDNARVERQRIQTEFQRQQEEAEAEHLRELHHQDAEHREQRERDYQLFEQQLQEMHHTSADARQQLEQEFRRRQKKLKDEVKILREQRQHELEKEKTQKNLELQQILDKMQTVAEAEQARVNEEFQNQQQEKEKKWTQEKQLYEERLAALNDSIQEADERAQLMTEQLEKPTKDREQKLAFVNELNLQIRQQDSLLLLGPKGTGKSTFLWLLGKGDMPTRTMRDGTVEIIHVPGFIDSIGLRAWTVEEVLKLLVLMIYEGLPKDLIVFCNERIDMPMTTLELLGISNPMVVVMSSDFWRLYQPKAGSEPKIHLVPNKNGVRWVEPEENLANVYNFHVYDEVKQLELGTPITHHDDIDALVQKRESDGVGPFQFLTENPRGVFAAAMENDYTTEAIFRFIYIYEKKYRKNKLQFMNQATLNDFV